MLAGMTRANLLMLTPLALSLAVGCSEKKEEQPTPDTRTLHVASPDWRDQVIYFVMTDRFANGDATNDDQGGGEYDPADEKRYSGGDLKGIVSKLDYIQGLGATALWITPPVANQWWDPVVDYSGYHGYWARDFKAVDEHAGTLDDYKDLSHGLHERGMYLIQDIVANHTGNFFYWPNQNYSPSDPSANFRLNTASTPVSAPTAAPFDQNDVTNPDDVAAAIYHFTPQIADYSDPVQQKTWALSDLDDLNTTNPVVQAALQDAYSYWITEVGVDGFRIDTALYVEHEFWASFVPAVEAAAASTGRDDFLTFGEAAVGGAELDDSTDQLVASYLGSAAAPEMKAMLHFTLYNEIDRVIAKGRPTSWLTYRLDKFMSVYPNPHIMPTFIDNHDAQRFLTDASEDALRQALALVMTLPGIPVIYYGTEQGFTETRRAMFAGGYLSQGKDGFNPASPWYTSIHELAALRTASPVLTRGDLTVLRDNPGGPGVFIYKRSYEGESVVVMMNTSSRNMLVSGVDLGVPEGTVTEKLYAYEMPDDVVMQPVLARLEPRAIAVLKLGDTTTTITPPDTTITVDTQVEGQTFTGDFPLSGTVTPPVPFVYIIVDDDLDNAVRARPDEVTGTFTATVPTARFPLGASSHTLVLWASAKNVATDRMHFDADITFNGTITTVPDPEGDDTGPGGTYTYPQDASFGTGRYMDVVEVTVEAGPAIMNLHFKMKDWSTVWNPTNGFDHVCFTTFFDLPGQDGATFLPRLQASAPEDFTWDLMHFTSGWDNSVFGTDGATADAWGASKPAPSLEADPQNKTLTFSFNRTEYGIDSWEGVKIYVTTWDFDGVGAEYRPISADGGPWTVGGGAGDGPKIMDQVGPITIPAP